MKGGKTCVTVIAESCSLGLSITYTCEGQVKYADDVPRPAVASEVASNYAGSRS